MLKFVKDLLSINDDMGEDVEKALEEEAIQSYTAIVNSNKYADSNSNTDALEKLLTALKVQNDGEPKTTVPEVPVVGKELDKDKPTDQTVGDDPAKIERMFDGRRGYRFIDNLDRHLQLLADLENEALPAQPVFTPAKFGKDGGTNFVLKRYPIPVWIYESMRANNVNTLQIKDPLTPSNYMKRFQKLLWIEEAQQAIEMRRYDLLNVMVARYDIDFFLVKVPGLAEGRPSLMRGDRLLLKSEKRSSYYEGYIHDVRENDILIKLHESLHSSAMDGLRFDVSFFSSRTPFRRCHHGISQFQSAKEIAFPIPKQESPKIKIEVNERETNNLRCFMKCINIYQKRAVLNILKAQCRPAPYIIFGPPGTGKTVTMVEAILQVYARLKDSKILVCGNSNASVDVLATRIKESGIVPLDKMVRVSAFYRMEKLIPPELEDVTKDMGLISSDMYKNYRVVITTCIQSGALYEFHDKFDYVFIDEAGHANEPEALVPAGMMKQDGCFVLAGDPHQLGPICISPVAGDHGLGTSLLERLCRRTVYQRQIKNSKMVYDGNYITKLLICYRSDPRVMMINKALFYHNELECKNKTPKLYMDLLKISHPLVFHGVKGKDRREYLNPSWFNPNEAVTCLSYANRLYSAGLKPDQLGIITPYRRQIEKINLLFESCSLKKCKIATMEEFQGDEREIIIISTVRTRDKYLEHDKKFKLGFLFNPKRFNVAISRAKWLVIVLGDPMMLNKDPCWVEYMKTAHKFGEIGPIEPIEVIDNATTDCDPK